MQRLNSVLRQGQKAIVDLGLLAVLRSEIAHELSSNRFQNDQIGDPGDFVVDWDAPESEDVLLRRKCESGEEVAVSALLGPEIYGGEVMFPREVLMKVCVKKPGFNSILQFDCGVRNGTDSGSEFHLRGAYYLASPASLHRSVYKGPLFSTLDPHLQDKLKEYLVAKGIGRGLTDFLLLYLHRKEQNQYGSVPIYLSALEAKREVVIDSISYLAVLVCIETEIWSMRNIVEVVFAAVEEV
ncbi:hypothetical protein NL676_001693 [Syzygium grande]|nr:hypothetical protein NL676_001693 [Syzygium grande]